MTKSNQKFNAPSLFLRIFEKTTRHGNATQPFEGFFYYDNN
ncbi:hypothetical protein CAEBREN_06739 [Caenorhabditis brenneri]|uniref:Uncharacterized protein n=1 Tax=Caenorhabditis brenneri TaxID=135651 RepID=G0N310_CAEBE|nr:hypothetical protein CAEBREN_06739 [Caenorhabditis brenneri]